MQVEEPISISPLDNTVPLLIYYTPLPPSDKAGYFCVPTTTITKKMLLQISTDSPLDLFCLQLPGTPKLFKRYYKVTRLILYRYIPFHPKNYAD